MAIPEIIKLYTIQNGDTFGVLANRFYTTVAKLTELNPTINPNTIYVGQRIRVPLPIITYTVKNGEVLSTIASKYKTTSDYLLELNPTITVNNIYAGLQLYVPIPVGKFKLLTEEELQWQSLMLTSQYETSRDYPYNFGVTSGNHDNAGISFGCIQFNAKTGSLIEQWQNMINYYPEVTLKAFMDNTSRTPESNQANHDSWKALFLRGDFAEILAWADSRSDLEKQKHGLKEPWNSYLMNLGTTQESIEMQKNYSSWYHQIAKQWFDQLELFSRQSYALIFDIAVQSGSMNPKVDGVVYDLIGEINQWWETVDKTGKTVEELEKEKLIKIANRRADYIDISWQESYRDRKVTIAEGYGEVYGSIMDTAGKYNMGLEPAYMETIPNELMFTLEEDTTTPNIPIEITPALETTSYSLTVSAKLSDDDNNNVKLIVEASLSSDFTNSVIKESSFVNSGEVASVTIDGLDFNTIDTRVYLRLKSTDGILVSDIVEHNFYHRVSKPANTQVYTVVSGDNLAIIASKYNTTTENLLILNPFVETNNIYPSQNIYVPIVDEEPVEEPIGEPTEPVIEEPVPEPEPEPVIIEEPLIFDDPVEDNRNYPQSMIFILDRTQFKIGVLNNDVPKALGYFNDIYTEALQSNLSTLEFEVVGNHPTAKLIEVEGYVIYTSPTNQKKQLFTIKEIEDSHSNTMTKRVYCEHSSISDLNSVIVRPVDMKSVTLEQALGIVLNLTGYQIGNVDFLGLRDINIESYMTSLEALHLVVEKFGELEFEVIFDGTHVKRKIVNVVQKRGKDTGKIFEYSRNLTEIRRQVDSTRLVTALIGVGKSTNDVPLTFLNYNPPANDEYIKVDDWIYSVESFQRYHKQSKQIFGVFIDDVATNYVELYDRTLEKLKEVSVPIVTYECSVVNFEQLTGLDFYRVEVGDQVVVKDFEFSENNPLLLNARVIEKKISINDPSRSEIKLGNFTIAQVNENQVRILQQFQKAIMKTEEQYDKASEKAEQAIDKANSSYQVAEVAKETANQADSKAEQAITDTAQKLDKNIYEEEQSLLVAKIAEKANLVYVDGMLVDKVNKGDVFTKIEIEETLLGFVSELTYETDQNGLVERLELAESDIQQTKEGFKATVTKADLETIEIGAKNYIRNGNFRDGLNFYTTSGSVVVNDISSLAGFSKVLYASSTSNGYAGITIKNIISNPNSWLGKSVVLSFYAIYENVVSGTYAWEKLNGGLYFQCKFTDGTTAWVYPQLPLSTVGTNYNWQKYVQKVTFDVADGKEIAEILDIRVKAMLENCTGMFWITGIMLELGKYATDFSENPLDGEKIAVDFAESQFTQTAELIATKVEKNGVISAINQTAESVKIEASKIFLQGYVESTHIKSLNGLVVGDNQLVIDSLGNATFAGTLNGADGIFKGSLVGGSISSDTTIDVTTDLHVGQNIYLKMESGIERFTNKGLIFYEKEGQSLKTKITGDYLTLDIECTNRIRFYSELIDFNSPKIWIDGQMEFSGAEMLRTSGTEKGVAGIGAVSPTTTNNANIAGVSVNFRVKKNSIPSSVTLTNTSWTTEPNYTNITQDGFWLYVKTPPTGLIYVGGYYYWRGTYEC